uniref:Putative lipid exporter abca1 n=1 Tax=Amblyomma triste TaxID=251400 RepID=A0A023GBL8_AMBTT
MFLVGIVFFCINLFLEFHLKTSSPPSDPKQAKATEDSDVVAERIRANGDTGKQDVLRVLDVVKIYQGRQRAVDNVSFGIPKGECFGLLGVNGAGKTTLFRILTGQLQPTRGTTLVQDTRLDKVFSKGTQLVGYCPQADALDDLLSPKEHLVIYSMMRGIPKSEIKEVVEEALSRFQLSIHANHKVGTLSRGTRRKVCTAIAMLGNPQIVLLDEPTSGMDPVTRRLVWSNVSEAIREKRSVLLTSHSMAECDLLCSRLAIMVNGQLCCIGSPQYLKHKFGAGFTVTIRMVEKAQDWKQTIKFFITHFPMASLKAHHYNIVEFSLPSKQTSLSSVFKFLETNSGGFGILDFSVSQTTLDQVFVNFARQQSDESALQGDQEMTADTSTASEKNGFISDEVSAVNIHSPNLLLPVDVKCSLSCEATRF